MFVGVDWLREAPPLGTWGDEDMAFLAVNPSFLPPTDFLNYMTLCVPCLPASCRTDGG